MGFEEIFVFGVVGGVAIWRSRLKNLDRSQITFLWILAVASPSLAIAWIILKQATLPFTLFAIAFLLCIWIYRNWLAPTNLEPITLTLKEEKQLKDCFPATVYHFKGLEYRSQEIYCRGDLRSQNPKNSYDTVNQNIQKIFGDRFLFYLQESYLENSGVNFGAVQTDQQRKTSYCFYLIPRPIDPRPTNFSDRLVSIISVIFTAITVLAVGANIHKLEDINLTSLQSGLPYLLSIASIFIARAIAQYVIARQHKLQLDPPLFLPCISGFGLLGSLTTKNHTNQRHILFDLAVIPAIASLAISLILLILGNWILVPTTPALSPLILAGRSGLALSALQLMPFDLLDGGNLAIAMFGHRQAVQISRITRLVLLAIALLVQPWLKIYSLLLFLLPTPQPIVLNESSELDQNRDLVGMILIAIVLLIILPIPKFL